MKDHWYFIKSESALFTELELALEETFRLKKRGLRYQQFAKDRDRTLISPNSDHGLSKEITKAQRSVFLGENAAGIVDEYPYENQADTTIIPLIGGLGQRW